VELWIVAMIAAWVFSIAAGRYVAVAKRRTPGEGAIFGAAFGPLGVLIEACLPDDGMTAQERQWANEEREADPPARTLRRVGR
jgi:hypothetical protein